MQVREDSAPYGGKADAQNQGSAGYRKAASFHTATLVYDATYWLCEKFLDSACAW